MASLKNEQWSSLGSRVANARPRGLSGKKEESQQFVLTSLTIEWNISRKKT
ncbi:hypothetical protein TBC1_11104 [Lentimicrobium saccharophilum]|uniref:Uncharacterized protein n=1 Tax=Lentimicrobium saccharophilum TaxID=1678841 RepID=A0A0S7BZC3_9BACT|nr:hypothetical protein [Lentimicrobium saccharophilum]GAP41976.1 hypothetical protein TBC1_11104 [Lentimicrobium saccharophilum]